jgi:hypothetical protein
MTMTMTVTAVRERMERMRTDAERYTSAMVVIDLLLDARACATARRPLAFIDAELSRISHRNLLSAVELQMLLDQLDVALSDAEARPHGERRLGWSRSIPRSLFDREQNG